MDRIVSVTFYNDNRNYAYRTDDPTIEVGNKVIVDSPSSGLVVVTVGSIAETVENVTKASKWIVQKIDTAAYEARIAKEERRKVLLIKIDRAKQEAMEKLALSEAAKLSPELAEAVKELEGL